MNVATLRSAVSKLAHPPEAAPPVRQQSESVQLERRRAARARIAEIQAAAEKASPEKRKRLEAARAKAAAARIAFDQALAEAAQAEAELADRAGDAERARLDDQLRQTAPAEIDAFLAELDGLAERVRNAPPTFEMEGSLHRGRMVVASRAAAEWLGRYREVASRAADLAVEALDDAALAERLASLRAELGPPADL
jgi:hypothetical protein